MFAFIGHASACEAFRMLGASQGRWERLLSDAWPPEPRLLPLTGACASNQRMFKQLCADVDLASLGIVSRPIDLLVPRPGMRSKGQGARFHVWSRALPPRSMLRAANSLFISAPELAVIQLCGAQAKLDGLLGGFAETARAQKECRRKLGTVGPTAEEAPTAWESMRRVVDAAALICELAGSYRLPCPSQPASYGAPQLMSLSSLRRMLDRVGAGPEAGRVNRAASLAFEGSASPMETTLALLLTMPLEYGGFGLPKPQLNHTIDVSDAPDGISDRKTIKPDMLWPESKVVLEYDSTEFHGQVGISRLAVDSLRSNTLASMGYTVFRATPGMLRTLSDVALLARQIAHRLGTSLRQPSDLEALRREMVFVNLMPKRRDISEA